MDITTILFVIALSSKAVYSAPANDLTTAETSLKDDKMMLDDSSPVESKKTDDDQPKHYDETSEAILMESVKNLQMKDMDVKFDDKSGTDKDLTKEKKIEAEDQGLKQKIINSQDTYIFNKELMEQAENKGIKSVESEKKNVNNDDTPVVEIIDKTTLKNTEVKQDNEKSNLKSAIENKLDENMSSSYVEIKIDDLDPKLLKAVPELRTLDEVKSELKGSLEKLKEISKKEKPLVQQADDKGKAGISVSTTTQTAPERVGIIKNLANAAGHFITSLIQAPLTILASIREILNSLSTSVTVTHTSSSETSELSTTTVSPSPPPKTY